MMSIASAPLTPRNNPKLPPDSDITPDATAADTAG
jgi:hypothetical protein